MVNGFVRAVYNPASCYTLRATVSSMAFKSAELEIISADNNEGLDVYPNPSNTSFKFRLQTGSKEPVKIQIYDLSGRLVQEYNSLSPDDIITVGNDLNMGLFVAVVTQGKYRKFVKLIKTK